MPFLKIYTEYSPSCCLQAKVETSPPPELNRVKHKQVLIDNFIQAAVVVVGAGPDVGGTQQ